MPDMANFPKQKHYNQKDNICNSWIARTRRIVPELHKLMQRHLELIGLIEEYEARMEHSSPFEAEQLKYQMKMYKSEARETGMEYTRLLDKLNEMYDYIDEDDCMDRRNVSRNFKPNPRFKPNHPENEVKYLKKNKSHNYEMYDREFRE